jgi:hypothetical protein
MISFPSLPLSPRYHHGGEPERARCCAFGFVSFNLSYRQPEYGQCARRHASCTYTCPSSPMTTSTAPRLQRTLVHVLCMYKPAHASCIHACPSVPATCHCVHENHKTNTSCARLVVLVHPPPFLVTSRIPPAMRACPTHARQQRNEHLVCSFRCCHTCAVVSRMCTPAPSSRRQCTCRRLLAMCRFPLYAHPPLPSCRIDSHGLCRVSATRHGHMQYISQYYMYMKYI